MTNKKEGETEREEKREAINVRLWYIDWVANKNAKCDDESFSPENTNYIYL